MDYIPYGRQAITSVDIDAVVAVLRSDFLTQGPAVPLFEKTVAAYCGATEAVAVNSATSALHIACLALGLGAGDRLWTSPNTFVASANCARYCGAEVDFVDIDSRTYNLCPRKLEEKLQLAREQNRLPKIVIPVHFAGQSCDMAAIWRLANEYGFKVLEDASHAIGGRYRDQAVGCCAYSHATVFSFHPVKIVTTAEGGLVTTNDRQVAERLRLLRSHGITRDESAMVGPIAGPWYYEQIDLGFNYRMTDLQAALGVSQMTRLEHFLSRRKEIAARYDQAFEDFPLQLPYQEKYQASAWHLYVIQLLEHDRSSVFQALRRAGVGANVHYIPVHMQPYYRRLGCRPGQCPEAERYYSRAVSLPLFPTLTNSQQDAVIEVLRRVMV